MTSATEAYARNAVRSTDQLQPKIGPIECLLSMQAELDRVIAWPATGP